MRRELEAAVCGLLDHLEVDLGTLTTDEVGHLADLATLAVRCRSVVDRDPRTSEIVNVPPAEMPARLAKQLGRLLCGVRAIGADDAWPVVIRCALDSMPANRQAALAHLAGEATAVPTSSVGTALGLPTTTVRRTLEDLEAHGVVDRTQQGQGQADLWTLSEWCRRLWPTVPEKSEQVGTTSPPTPSTEGSYEPSPLVDDFSGEVPPATQQLLDAFPGAELVDEGEAA